MSNPIEMRCPQCKSNNLQVTVETTTSTSGGGYSGAKGCLGFLLLGPLGLLCGSGGKKVNVNTTNTNWWICQKCGHKFRNSEDVMAEKAAGFIVAIVAAIAFFVAEIFFGNIATFLTVGLWIGLVVSLIVAVFYAVQLRKLKAEQDKNAEDSKNPGNDE